MKNRIIQSNIYCGCYRTKDFVEKIANSDSEFIVFEDIDGQEIVLDRNEVKLRNKDILENYNISQEMSEDVR